MKVANIQASRERQEKMATCTARRRRADELSGRRAK